MERKEQYKKGAATLESIRDRRRDEEAELRKTKRDQAFNSKRVRVAEEEEESDLTTEQMKAAAVKLVKKDNRKEAIKALKSGFCQGTVLIDAFLQVDGAIDALVSVLTGSDGELQLQAAWCLTNIAAGTDKHAETVLKHAGSYLATYLRGHAALQDQCAWAIGNIAGGHRNCRDSVRALGAVPSLVDLLESPLPTVIQSASFALSNLGRDKEHTREMVDRGVLAKLEAHLVVSDDTVDTLAEIGWLLTYLAASGEHETEILATSILEKLVLCITQVPEEDGEEYQILTPLLRCLGNLCSDTDEACRRVCANDALIPKLGQLLRSDQRHIRKESLWVLANITAFPGACQQVTSEALIPVITHELASAFDIKKQAAFCLCNMGSQSEDLCRELLEAGVIQGMIPLLKQRDLEDVNMALSCCEMILAADPKGKLVFEEHGGLAALEPLEYHTNEEIRAATMHILDTYFYHEGGTPGTSPS